MNVRSSKKKWKQEYAKIEKLVNDRNDRERALILVVVLVPLILLWQTLFYDPVQEQRQKDGYLLKNTQNEVTKLNERLQYVMQGIEIDPLRPQKEQRNMMRENIKMIDDALKNLTNNLVSQEDMRGLLEDMLAAHPYLKVIRLQNAKRVALSEIGGTKEVSAEAPHLFRHGMELTFEGDYYTTIDFFKKLEAFKYNLIWDSLEYTVKDYPTATVKVLFRTLSDNEEWIGV